jgi:hypothetical protein
MGDLPKESNITERRNTPSKLCMDRDHPTEN